MVESKRGLQFADALKSAEPARFSAMVKPVGAICNMRCEYCYYIDKATLYDTTKRMSVEVLEEYVSQYIKANRSEIVTFSWHGGEPLLAGVDFYERALELQKKYSDGRVIENNIQTNGLLVDQRWCDFFSRNGFLVGISIDGPADLHDAHRRSVGGEPTFDRVISAIELMNRHGVEYNTMTVVSRLSQGRGVEVYEFLKSIGSRYMQFLPVVESLEQGRIVHPSIVGETTLGEWSVTGQGYGRFLNEIFDRWITRDVGQCFVQIFDSTLSSYMGLPPLVCHFATTCGDAMVVEHNGDVYSCDHFVYPEFKLGNILETPLSEIYSTPAQFAFGLAKRDGLNPKCDHCKYLSLCYGGCPKHRLVVAGQGEDGLNMLCEGLESFFRHTEPYMNRIASLLRQGRMAFEVMPWAQNNLKK